MGHSAKGPSRRPDGARRERPPAGQSRRWRRGPSTPSAKPGNPAPLPARTRRTPSQPPSPATRRDRGGAPGWGKPARMTRRTQENLVRKWPACRRPETQRPRRLAEGAGRTSAPRAQRLRPGSAPPARPSAPPPRIPAPPPPPPQQPLWELRAARPREAGAEEGGEGQRSPPPRRPARLPSPKPTHLLLLLLLVSPSWPPARPSRRRADAVPLPRGRRRRRRRPARLRAPAAAARPDRPRPRPAGCARTSPESERGE